MEVRSVGIMERVSTPSAGNYFIAYLGVTNVRGDQYYFAILPVNLIPNLTKFNCAGSHVFL